MHRAVSNASVRLSYLLSARKTVCATVINMAHIDYLAYLVLPADYSSRIDAPETIPVGGPRSVPETPIEAASKVLIE